MERADGIPRPLVVDLVGESGTLTEDERAVVDALEGAGSRVQLRVVPSARLADRWRRDGPDIAFACGDSAWAAVLAGWSAAVRVAVGVDGEPRRAWRSWLAERLADRLLAASLDGKALVQELATAGGRPGAGVEPSTPVSVVVTVLNEGDAVDRLIDSLSPQLGAGTSCSSTGDRRTTRWRGHGAGRGPTPAFACSRSRARTSLQAGTRHPGRNTRRRRVYGRGLPAGAWVARLSEGVVLRPRPALARNRPVRGACDRLVRSRHGGWRVPAGRRSSAAGGACALVRPGVRRTFDPTMPTGRSTSFTKDAWRTVGGFDEALETAEDVTFGRAIDASGGACLLDTDAVVEWEQRRSLRATARMYYRYGLGGGRTADKRVIGRDLARAGAYVVAPILLLWGGTPGRSVAVLGGAAYLSLPFARALGKPRPVAVAVLVPAAVALKDLAKAAGCVAGLIGRDGADREA